MNLLALASSALLLALGPSLTQTQGTQGAAYSAILLVGLAVIAASASARSFGAEAIVSGALGALGFVLSDRLGLPVGVTMALLMVAIHLPRSLRGGSAEARALLILLSAFAGLSAIWTMQWLAPPNSAAADPMMRIAALLSATLLLSLPYALNVDDTIAATLRRLAAQERSLHRLRLLRAVVLRRRLIALAADLDASLLRPFESAFRGVLELAMARIEARPEAARYLDERLDRRLRKIREALAAASIRAALLKGVEQTHAETLEAESEALRAECEALLQMEGEAAPTG